MTSVLADLLIFLLIVRIILIIAAVLAVSLLTAVAGDLIYYHHSEKKKELARKNRDAKRRLREEKENDAHERGWYADDPFVQGFDPQGNLLGNTWFIPSPEAQNDVKALDATADAAIFENTEEL